MDFGQFFVPNAQAPKLVQPGDRPFDDPTQLAHAGPMRKTPPRDAALDTALNQCLPMRLRVIGAVTEKALGAVTRCPALAADAGNRIDQRQQLSHIMRVGAREDRR